jgi:hypothetical protein
VFGDGIGAGERDGRAVIVAAGCTSILWLTLVRSSTLTPASMSRDSAMS